VSARHTFFGECAKSNSNAMNSFCDGGVLSAKVIRPSAPAVFRGD